MTTGRRTVPDAEQPRVKRPRKKRRMRQIAISWASLGSFLVSRWGEGLILCLLFLAALAIRWPYLLRLPHFTDETVELEWSLAIWRGEIFPLTASDRYYGPLHSYFVAFCFWLFGPSIILPRTIVMVCGALTVVLTYLLGRALANRAVGLVGAGLLATAPQHIIINSHVAWQNSTTPFYATLTFLALALYLNRVVRWTRSVEAGAESRTSRPLTFRGGGYWLPLAGFCYGLVLHTHVGTIVLAPALGLTVLLVVWRAKAWQVFRTPWPWLAPVMGLIAYSPVLIYNLMNGLAGLRRVQTRRDYAYETALSWEKYRQNLTDLGLSLTRMISNPMRIPEERWHYLTSPHLVFLVALCLIGLGLLVRRGQPLPFCALLTTTLIMPAFNKAYGQPWDRYMLTGRYLTFLLPLAFIAAAVTLTGLFGLFVRILPRLTRLPALRQGLLGVVGVAITVLVVYPLQPLARYYTHEGAKDPANTSILATVEFVRATRGERTPVIIGRKFASVDLRDGADMREIFDLLLDLESTPHVSPHNTHAEIERLVSGASPGDREALPLIIMTRDECWQMRDRRPFQRISERYRLRELYWDLPSYYAVYRYVPAGEPENCMPATGPEPGE